MHRGHRECISGLICITKDIVISIEIDPGGRPEDFYEDLLLWRPPLPVDRADYASLFKPVKDPDILSDVPGYAWERLPRWITEIEDTFKATPEKPVVCIDLGSSTPLNAQMLRALEFKRSGERARELARGLFGEDGFDAFQGDLSDLRPVHDAMSRNESCRALLEAAIQVALYTRNSYDMAYGDRDLAFTRLQERLGELLPDQSELYLMENSDRNIETRWGICFTSDRSSASYSEAVAALTVPSDKARNATERIRLAHLAVAEEIESKLRDGILPEEFTKKREITPRDIKRIVQARVHDLHLADFELAGDKEPIGSEKAERYIAWQIEKLANLIAGNDRYRPARFLSLDLSSRPLIASSSLEVTPDQTKSTNLFSHAIASLFDPRQHIAGDLFEPLPVPDNSLTFITCYDAWPIGTSFNGFLDNDGPMSDEEIELCIILAVDRLFSMYQKLTYKGKLVIFPWATYDNDDRSASILRRVTARLSNMIGHSVDRPIFHYAALQEIMSESELQSTSTLSNIFDDEEGYAVEALIIEKPARKLVERHTQAFWRRMAIAAGRIQD